MDKSFTSRNIKAIRDHYGLTQPQFGNKVGVSGTTVWQWEHGQPIRKNNLRSICEIFNVTEQDVYGSIDGFYAKSLGSVHLTRAEPSESYAPIIGNIAAGEPSEAIEYTGEQLWIPPELLERDPDTFYLYVTSDSMDQTEFRQGVYAAISPNSEVHNGDIAAVKVNGDDATLKIYHNHDGVIVLEPRSHNSDYKRIIIDSADPDSVYFRIVGKAVWPYYPINF